MIGPFTMQSADIAGAFNAFYSRNTEFPKPDPQSNENSMAGMDPYRAGISGNEIVFCQLSPLHRITLDVEAKVAANIPKESKYFAWAYPVVLTDEHNSSGAQSAQRAFLDYGGYTYFNENRDVVGTNSIIPAPLGTPGLAFGRAQMLPTNVCEILTRQGRFQEITLEVLAQKGATHFAWIRPQEFSDNVACPDGCFAYKFANGPPKYYPVVNHHVFTKDMLEEVLDDSEAWVVVRDCRKRPEVEQLLVFDKTKSLYENLDQNPNMASEKSSDALDGSGLNISVRQDSKNDGDLTYEEWSKMPDHGAISDPWIISIRDASNVGLELCEG